jgi:hypothetical protein
MKKLYGFLSVIITITMVIFLTDCKKDDGPSLKELDITGYAQKGPFINGSSVTVYDLQSDLSPTGKSYNAQITDNKGTFQMSKISLSSNNVSLRADGFYFNEISGQQSAAQITLYALSDISGKNEINVNILTQLEKSRVEYLMNNGKPFTDSKIQAQKEILAIFNIEDSDTNASEELSISESGDGNGILLAISSILQGYRSESELTEFLSDISNDIREDGVLNSSTLGSELINHAIILDTASIKNNLTKRYQDLGATVSIPDFGKYIAWFISKTEFKITQSFISYPETGIYGDNILSLSKTTFNGGLDVQHSFAAQLAKGVALKIKITSLGSGKAATTPADTITPGPKPMWYYDPFSNTNWSITVFDNANYTQTFTATEPDKSCDLKVYFEKGSFLIEYFEMNATLPTKGKTIICN